MKNINWKPEKPISQLIEELEKIKSSMDEDNFKCWCDRFMSNLPSAQLPGDIRTQYPIWAMDNQGFCLVGPEGDEIEHIDSIMEFYA